MRRSVFSSVLAIGLATSSFVAVETVLADSDTTAQRVNTNKSNMYRPRSKFSVDLGTSFANPKSNVIQRDASSTLANVNGSSSKNITSIGVDYRVPLFFFLANLGNVANVDLGCPECRADIANVANIAFRPIGPVVGMWGRAFLGGDDRNEVGFRLHNNSGPNDTFSSYSKSFFILPYIGYAFALKFANNPVDLTVFAGPRLERRKIKFKTDQGSGFQEASNSETDVGLTVGFDVDIPLTGMYNVGNARTGLVPFFRIGAAYDWSPAINVSGTTTGPSFDYTDKIKSGGTFRLFFGGGVLW